MQTSTTTTTTSPRTALYARVSTTGHGQDVGLQLDELRQVACQRGWCIVAEHVDDGVSGATTSRPALDRLMDGARRGQLDLVAVWRLDRLGRSLQHLLAVLDELRHLGVGFVSLRDSGIDTRPCVSSSEFNLPSGGFIARVRRVLVMEPQHGAVRNPIGLRDRAILEVFYSCGVRRNEMCRLRVVEVDFERKTSSSVRARAARTG